MSKGSSPRPYGVSLDTYGQNFDRIFGKPAEEPEEVEEPEDDDEDDLCSACNGSGEGMYDGSTCSTCHGYGHERPERDEDY